MPSATLASLAVSCWKQRLWVSESPPEEAAVLEAGVLHGPFIRQKPGNLRLILYLLKVTFPTLD